MTAGLAWLQLRGIACRFAPARVTTLALQAKDLATGANDFVTRGSV